MSGTSMATPHVAGLLAILWQALCQQPVLVNAALVSGWLLAVARTKGFVHEVEIADRGGRNRSYTSLAGGAGRASLAAWCIIPAAPASVPGLESGLRTDQSSPGSGRRAKWS
jgi:hypothetical protein